MEANELIIYILDYLDANLYRAVSIQELSLYFGYEKSYLMKKFKNEIGISIKSYVNKMKIISSLKILNSDEMLLKVAINCGFNSLEYYSEIFSKVIGVSPSTFRKYLIGHVNKEELEIIKTSIKELNAFKLHIWEYKKSINEKKSKLLRLTIPQEKKCA